MGCPEIRAIINHALAEAKRIATEGVFIPLWASPEWKADSRFWAKVASHRLNAARDHIFEAVADNNKQFFMDLGKCLAKEIDATILDSREGYLVSLLSKYPSITSKDAIADLIRAGYPALSEENFRMLKKRVRAKWRTLADKEASRSALSELAERVNTAGA